MLPLIALLIGCQLALPTGEPDTIRTDTTLLKEVSVSADRQRMVYRLDRKRISAEEVLTSQGGTALDVLRALPGVAVDADGHVTMRGSGAFLVYIDGKPSPMTGTEALMQVPAAVIKDLEILTTPPARYKTEGDVGIINIITRRPQGEGLGVEVNATGGTQGTWGTDAKINYKWENHNIYLGGQGTRIRTESNFEQFKSTQVDDFLTQSRAKGTRFGCFGTYVGRAGYEWMDGLHHHFTADFEAGVTNNPRGGDMDYDEQRWQLLTPLSHKNYESHDRYRLKKHLYQGAFSYTWKINERGDLLQLQNRLRYDSYSLEYTESNMFDANGTRHEGTRGYEQEHHWDADGSLLYQLHYTEKGRLEAGYQYTTYSEHGDYNIYYWVPAMQAFENQTDLHAPFYYRRQNHSIYTQWNDRFGPFQADAGIRAERLIDKMELPTITSRYRKYLDWFPSAHLGYTSETAGTFTLGYSRRVNRPGIWKLEPYITYEDYYTRIIGNPDLKAEYIHSMELQWRKTLQDGLSLQVAAFARYRNDVVDVVRRAYEPGVTLDSIINAGNQWDVGLEAQLNTKVTQWWKTTAQASVYHYNFNATYQGSADSNGITGQAEWINNFTLGKNTRAQLDGHYVAPRNLTQGREDGYVYFDIALRQQLRNGQWSLGLVAHDVFHTAKYHSLRTTEMLRSETWVRPRYPNFTLSVAYRFNQKKASSTTDNNAALKKEAEFTGSNF